jgi:GT2 family glycosyltransferase
MVQERFPDVRLIANKDNYGFVYANNQGSSLAKGKYLLILNSDTVIKDPGLNKIIEYMEQNPGVGIATGRMEYEDGGFQEPYRRYPTLLMVLWMQTVGRLSHRLVPFRRWLKYQGQEFKQAHDVDWVTGAYLFIRCELLDGGKVFDDAIFMYYEDLLLCARVHQSGYRVVYLPFGNVVHLCGRSAKKVRPLAILYSFRSSVVYLSKRYGVFAGHVYRLLARGIWRALLLMLFCVRVIMGNAVNEKIELYRYLLKEECR